MVPFEWITAEQTWHYIAVGVGIGQVGVGLVGIYFGLTALEVFRFWLWLGVLLVGLGLLQLFYLVPRVDDATLSQSGDTDEDDD